MERQCEKCGIYTTGDFYKIYPKPETSQKTMLIMCPKCGQDYIYASSWTIAKNYFDEHKGIVTNDCYGVNYINLNDGTHIEYNKYYKNYETRLRPYFTGLRSWNDYTE